MKFQIARAIFWAFAAASVLFGLYILFLALREDAETVGIFFGFAVVISLFAWAATVYEEGPRR